MDIKRNIKRFTTISALANNLGIQQSTLSEQIIKGTISANRLQEIANILNCSVTDLVSEEENNNNNDNNNLVCPHCGASLKIHIE